MEIRYFLFSNFVFWPDEGVYKGDNPTQTCPKGPGKSEKASFHKKS
jgi:hypothetical protein